MASTMTAMESVLTCKPDIIIISSPHDWSARSLPCLAASNNTHLCPDGYWLCEDAKQCILKGYSFQQLQGEGFISNFCDGMNHCKDGSDEKLGQCLQVREDLFSTL